MSAAHSSFARPCFLRAVGKALGTKLQSSDYLFSDKATKQHSTSSESLEYKRGRTVSPLCSTNTRQYLAIMRQRRGRKAIDWLALCLDWAQCNSVAQFSSAHGDFTTERLEKETSGGIMVLLTLWPFLVFFVPIDFPTGPLHPHPQGRRGHGRPWLLQGSRGQGCPGLPPQVGHPH